MRFQSQQAKPRFLLITIVKNAMQCLMLRCDTRFRLLHAVAFLKKSHRLAQTKVITLKTQLHAANAR
jgi:hypothetical protein